MIIQNERKIRAEEEMLQKKQTSTSLSHIPVILMKFEIIFSVVSKTKRHGIRKKCTKFCLHYITLLRAFGERQN